MDDGKKSGLLELCDGWYNHGGMTSFENKVNDYAGTKEEIEFLNNLKGLLRILNSSGGTRIFGFTMYSSVSEIIDISIKKLICNDLYSLSVKDKMQRYKEFFISTHPQQF